MSATMPKPPRGLKWQIGYADYVAGRKLVVALVRRNLFGRLRDDVLLKSVGPWLNPAQNRDLAVELANELLVTWECNSTRTIAPLKGYTWAGDMT